MSHENWSTPPEFFAIWDRKFHFERDVCANATNAKCRTFFTRRDDALAKPWTGVCWMNPPYSRQIHKWVKKAWESAQAGATVVCLLPASTDTNWFHQWCKKGHVVFVRGRLSFKGHGMRKGKGRAGFPSIVVVFHAPRNTCSFCRDLGDTVRTVQQGGSA